MIESKAILCLLGKQEFLFFFLNLYVGSVIFSNATPVYDLCDIWQYQRSKSNCFNNLLSVLKCVKKTMMSIVKIMFTKNQAKNSNFLDKKFIVLFLKKKLSVYRPQVNILIPSIIYVIKAFKILNILFDNNVFK